MPALVKGRHLRPTFLTLPLFCVLLPDRSTASRATVCQSFFPTCLLFLFYSPLPVLFSSALVGRITPLHPPNIQRFATANRLTSRHHRPFNASPPPIVLRSVIANRSALRHQDRAFLYRTISPLLPRLLIQLPLACSITRTVSYWHLLYIHTTFILHHTIGNCLLQQGPSDI